MPTLSSHAVPADGPTDTSEIHQLINILSETFDGDPWFGRSVKAILSDVDEAAAFTKLNKQHSILELVWHMISWREFTIDRLQPAKTVAYFEEADWRELDHDNKALWQQGLQRLDETQEELIALLQKINNALLDQPVKGKKYNFRTLLQGIVQHDIYHLGQIAWINKWVHAAIGQKSKL